MPTDPVLPAPHTPRPCRLDEQIDPFLRHLRLAGYADRTLRKKRSVLRAFARWTRREAIPAERVNLSHLDAFLRRPPRRRPARMRFERSVLRPFVSSLASPLAASPRVVTPGEDLARRYAEYLRQERGLAENSLRAYLPYIRAFLRAPRARTGSAGPRAWDAGRVRTFLLAERRTSSGASMPLLAAALRSFLRFCYLRGETARDLSAAVPTIRRWRQAAVPPLLSPAEVERVLGAPDRSTPRGRRDYAILLLLARLGLRAHEVVTLELDDLGWRTGELRVRGKGGAAAQLPLPAEVGAAVARYLQDRGASTSRRVFLRLVAPRVGLTGPAAIGHLVRRAFARGGGRPPGRGAAHLFRHSLATRMLRHGASLAAIGEVLRHQSPNTTALYAKVAFATLREVARPWPAGGGGR